MNFSMSSSELHRKFPTASYVHVPQPCSPFYILKCSEKSCSESTASGTNQLDMVKCEANLALDQKVDFSQNYPCQKYCAFNPVQPQIASQKSNRFVLLQKYVPCGASFGIDQHILNQFPIINTGLLRHPGHTSA